MSTTHPKYQQIATKQTKYLQKYQTLQHQAVNGIETNNEHLQVALC